MSGIVDAIETALTASAGHATTVAVAGIAVVAIMVGFSIVKKMFRGSH